MINCFHKLYLIYVCIQLGMCFFFLSTPPSHPLQPPSPSTLSLPFSTCCHWLMGSMGTAARFTVNGVRLMRLENELISDWYHNCRRTWRWNPGMPGTPANPSRPRHSTTNQLHHIIRMQADQVGWGHSQPISTCEAESLNLKPMLHQSQTISKTWCQRLSDQQRQVAGLLSDLKRRERKKKKSLNYHTAVPHWSTGGCASLTLS